MQVAAESLTRSNAETTLEEDTVFDLLGNERRRASLKHLIDSDGETPVGELARDVAEDIVEESTPAEDVQRSVYISLCQSHLPKLDRASIVEYDADVKTVEPGPAFEAVEPYLETHRPNGNPWAPYLVISLGTVLVLAISLGTRQFVGLGPALAVVVAHVAVSAYVVYRLLS